MEFFEEEKKAVPVTFTFYGFKKQQQQGLKDMLNKHGEKYNLDSVRVGFVDNVGDKNIAIELTDCEKSHAGLCTAVAIAGEVFATDGKKLYLELLDDDRHHKVHATSVSAQLGHPTHEGFSSNVGSVAQTIWTLESASDGIRSSSKRNGKIYKVMNLANNN